MSRIVVYLPDALLEDLRFRAEKRGVSVTEYIRTAVSAFRQIEGYVKPDGAA